jgi:2-oxoglutarate dehydrogenase E2 component (dihydrolipoamide succinyltransferase)
MARQLSQVPHVTAVFECDCSAIVAHRTTHKSEFAGKNAALTYTAYFVQAAAQAMPTAPAVNGRWSDTALALLDDINIGVGTATPDGGLMVPVIRRAQDKSLFDIAQALTDLTERARANKLVPADVQGGTFSISNHGVSGTLIAAPIVIVEGQSAILGIGKMEKRAVVRNDAVVIRPMCYVTLTIDHRPLDGQQCNAWLTKFVETVEGWPA